MPENMLILAAHFPWPGLGRVVRAAENFSWSPIQ